MSGCGWREGGRGREGGEETVRTGVGESTSRREVVGGRSSSRANVWVAPVRLAFRGLPTTPITSSQKRYMVPSNCDFATKSKDGRFQPSYRREQ